MYHRNRKGRNRKGRNREGRAFGKLCDGKIKQELKSLNTSASSMKYVAEKESVANKLFVANQVFIGNHVFV